jgi:hypothetical protein
MVVAYVRQSQIFLQLDSLQRREIITNPRCGGKSNAELIDKIESTSIDNNASAMGGDNILAAECSRCGGEQVWETAIHLDGLESCIMNGLQL